LLRRSGYRAASLALGANASAAAYTRQPFSLRPFVVGGERTSKNYAFVDAVARKNVEITMADIRKDSPVLAAMESNGAIKIADAMYNLQTGVIDFFAG
jgi:hypothetical protein